MGLVVMNCGLLADYLLARFEMSVVAVRKIFTCGGKWACIFSKKRRLQSKNFVIYFMVVFLNILWWSISTCCTYIYIFYHLRKHSIYLNQKCVTFGFKFYLFTVRPGCWYCTQTDIYKFSHSMILQLSWVRWCLWLLPAMWWPQWQPLSASLSQWGWEALLGEGSVSII